MLKSDSFENRRSVNHQSKIRYLKKIPKNSNVFIKTKSQDKYKGENSSNEFKSIIKQIYSEINQKQNLNKENKDNDNTITFLSPIRKIYKSTMHKRKKRKQKLFPNNSQKKEFRNNKNKISIKRVKPKKEKEDIFSPFFDYYNKLLDGFTQISIIRPNKNDIFFESNTDSDIQKEEYVHLYDPNKDLKLDLENSSKREIKNIFENNYFTDNKLIIWGEINFSIDKQINEHKNKLNYKDLIEKGEKYDKLINEYNILLKELNELKNKNTINSASIRGEEIKIQHLEDINIVNNFNNKEAIKRKRQKIKKVKKKRMKSLTPNIRYISSSEETKTRDNSKKGVCTPLSNELTNKIFVPNIMIISKENEFNLAASYTKLLTNDVNDNTITNKPKKKIKKIIKKNDNKENNWNSSKKIIDNITLNYIGNINNTSINNIKKNKAERKTIRKIKKRILKKKENSRERNRSKSKGSCRKIKKINVPVINIKNEIFSYKIKKKYFRFNIETKSVDYKYDNTNHNTINSKQLNHNLKLFHNHSNSMNLDKNKKHKDFNDDIIIKNINLHIINKFNKNKQEKKIFFENKNNYCNGDTKEYNDYKDKNIILDKKENGEGQNGNGIISENKEFSYFSNKIKDNSDFLSENEKHKKGNNKTENFNENNNIKTKNENIDKKYIL